MTGQFCLQHAIRRELYPPATLLAGLLLVLGPSLATEGRGGTAWLKQDLSAGYGRIKMADSRFVGRFGGGSWSRLNGADFDGDGDLDLVATFGAGGGARGTYSGLYVYENVVSATMHRLDAVLALAPHELIHGATPYVGDANRDSRPDIFCNGLLFLNQSQAGSLRFAPPSAAADPHWPHPAECDWNADDVPDRFEEDRWQLRWLDGKSGRSRPLKVGQQEILLDVFIRPFICDWDNDQDLDVLVGQESGHITWVQNANGRLLAEEYVLQSDPNVHSGCASVPVICDWDGDEDMDLIVGNAAGFIEFFEYQDGQFAPVQRLRAGAEEIRVLAGEFGSVQGPAEARWGYTCPEVADWDIDGDLDLLVGCVTGETLFYENIGSRKRARLAPAKKLTLDPGLASPVYPEGLRFTPEPGVLVSQWRCRPVVVDWNKDGLPDYVTIDERGFLACYPRLRHPDDSLGLGPAEHPFLDQDLVPLRFCSHPKPGRNGRIKLTLVDWDGDGDLDIIRSGGLEDGMLNLDNHLNFTYLECLRVDEHHRSIFTWRGELTHSGSIRLQGHSSAPVTFDVDGNGTLDIVSGCEDGNVYWFLREWIDDPQRFSADTVSAAPSNPD